MNKFFNCLKEEYQKIVLFLQNINVGVKKYNSFLKESLKAKKELLLNTLVDFLAILLSCVIIFGIFYLIKLISDNLELKVLYDLLSVAEAHIKLVLSVYFLGMIIAVFLHNLKLYKNICRYCVTKIEEQQDE